jgi:hypothetical protein
MRPAGRTDRRARSVFVYYPRMNSTRGILAGAFALAFVLAAACGGGASGRPSVRSFTGAPSSLPPGGGEATLAWNVHGALFITIDHGVGLVSGSAGTVSVALSTSTTFTLTAQNHTAVATAQATVVVPATITVSGTVLLNGPLPGVSVAVLGQGLEAVVSDTAGHFTIAGVVPPYDLAASDAVIGDTIIFRGVSKTDPTFHFLAAPVVGHTATIVGGLTNGGFPTAAGTSTIVRVFSPEGIANGATVTPATGAYSITPSWNGPSTTQARLHALQIVNGPPMSFTGQVSSSVLVHPGDTVVAQNLALVPMTTGTISGTTIPPPGANVIALDLSLRYGGGGVPFGIPQPTEDVLRIASVFSTAAGFSLKSPVVPSTSLDLDVFAFGSTVMNSITTTLHGLSANASGLSIVSAAPPLALLPVNGTVTDPGTNFSIDAPPSSVNHFYFYGGGTPLRIEVVTTANQISMPDFAEIGAVLPPGVTMNWQAESDGPFGSIDESLSTLPPSTTVPTYSGFTQVVSITIGSTP